MNDLNTNKAAKLNETRSKVIFSFDLNSIAST